MSRFDSFTNASRLAAGDANEVLTAVMQDAWYEGYRDAEADWEQPEKPGQFRWGSPTPSRRVMDHVKLTWLDYKARHETDIGDLTAYDIDDAQEVWVDGYKEGYRTFYGIFADSLKEWPVEIPPAPSKRSVHIATTAYMTIPARATTGAAASVTMTTAERTWTLASNVNDGTQGRVAGSYVVSGINLYVPHKFLYGADRGYVATVWRATRSGNAGSYTYTAENVILSQCQMPFGVHDDYELHVPASGSGTAQNAELDIRYTLHNGRESISVLSTVSSIPVGYRDTFFFLTIDLYQQDSNMPTEGDDRI